MPPESLQPSLRWHAAHRGGAVGLLVMRGVANPPHHPALQQRADELERQLRTRFATFDRQQLRAVPPLPGYAAYYKRFGQRYHVAMQLESVAHKEKPVPRPGALVTAMFVAELEHLVLTAGHDLDAVALPVRLDVGTGTESYQTPPGTEITVKPNDMYTADANGVLSAIITGPSAAARITPGTTAALFVAYVPPGVSRESLETHLAALAANVQLVNPAAPPEIHIVTATG